MMTVHCNSQPASAARDAPGCLRAALKRFVEHLLACRARGRTSGGLRARSEYSMPEDIRLTRAKIDPEWLRLEWF
jgi:hypothetical protein